MGCIVLGNMPAFVMRLSWFLWWMLLRALCLRLLPGLAGCVVVGFVPAFVTVLSLIPISLSITYGQLTARTYYYVSVVFVFK